MSVAVLFILEKRMTMCYIESDEKQSGVTPSGLKFCWLLLRKVTYLRFGIPYYKSAIKRERLA